MNVFISWSGERSRKVATALKEWLPIVIQSVVPWFSPEDIDKGARWMAELAKQLDKLNMGIICVTPENREAPWLLFEAGALSKALDTSLVCPLLLGVEPADLQGPLAQFQATRATREDVRKLLDTINKNSESSLAEPQIEQLFSFLWPGFEEKLVSIEASAVDQVSRPRPVPELLSEVLERVRSIERQLAEKAALEQDRNVGAQLASMKEQEARLKRREEKLSSLRMQLFLLEKERLELEQRSLEVTNAAEKEEIGKRQAEMQEKIARINAEMHIV
jgi:hypothetical protein